MERFPPIPRLRKVHLDFSGLRIQFVEDDPNGASGQDGQGWEEPLLLLILGAGPRRQHHFKLPFTAIRKTSIFSQR